jgi:hypothetical protein
VARAGGLERHRRGVAREHLALEVGTEARILRHQDAGADDLGLVGSRAGVEPCRQRLELLAGRGERRARPGQLGRPPRLGDPLARFDAGVEEPSAADRQARRRREPLQDLLAHLRPAR